MAEFIGLQMLVGLREPVGRQLKGTVKDIQPGHSLTLSNVLVVDSNQRYEFLTLYASNVTELTELKADQLAQNTESSLTTLVPVSTRPAKADFTAQDTLSSLTTVVPVPTRTGVPLVDPAIVSVRANASLASGGVTAHVWQPSRSRADEGPRLGQPGVLPAPRLLMEDYSVSNLGSAVETLSVEERARAGTVESELAPGLAVPGQSVRKKRRDRFQKNRQSQDEGAVVATRRSGRGKGWRQTPILQSSSNFQPYDALKHQGGPSDPAPVNSGWASEDVTEEMGDFDFEGGLAKFDKRSLFDQMKKEDLVDDSSRLVTVNRRTKQGGTPARNLQPTENVLDGGPSLSARKPVDFWNSEADDTANAASNLSGRDVRSQQSNRRADGKSEIKKPQSRKPSATGQPIRRVNSALSQTQQSDTAGLYLLPSRRKLEPVSALQMLNLENIAANDLGLTQDMMTENAGRGIAEVSLTALADPAIVVRFGSGSGSGPGLGLGNSQVASLAASSGGGGGGGGSGASVVVLAGNNKSGVRSVAAARHLRNKGIKIVLCLPGIEREADLLEDMKQQVRIFRNFGGRVYSKHEFFEHLRVTASEPRPVVVALIIDALLGLTLSFEELRTGDQAVVYELIEWANRNEAFVLALDVPTGIDPSTGKATVIDGLPLYIKPRYVVALGAPKRGLVEAVAAAHEEPDRGRGGTGLGGGASMADGVAPIEAKEDEWNMFVADMGLGSSVWRKAGTRHRRGIDFDDSWVLRMVYHGPELDDDG